MTKLRQLHGEEVKQLRDEIKALKENLAGKISEMKQMRKDYEEEFERKSQKIIEERHESPNDILTKQNTELRDKLEKVEKELFQKIK